MQLKSSDVLNYGKEVDSPSMADAPMRAYRPGVDQVYTEHPNTVDSSTMLYRHYTRVSDHVAHSSRFQSQ